MARADIETRERTWLDAFNAGDASGVATVYAESARLMAPNADTFTGRAAIEEFVKAFVTTGAQLSFELLDVHDAGDLCVAVGTYTMTFPGDAEVTGDRGKYLEVWARHGEDGWQIVDDMFNSSLPAPA